MQIAFKDKINHTHFVHAIACVFKLMSFCYFSDFYDMVKSIESQSYCTQRSNVKGLFIVQAFTMKINNNNAPVSTMCTLKSSFFPAMLV